MAGELTITCRFLTKAEKERLERLGQSATNSPPAVRAAAPAAATMPAATKDYSEARIQVLTICLTILNLSFDTKTLHTCFQFRTPTGTLTQTFKSDDTLNTVYIYVASQIGNSNFKLLQTFPRKVLEEKSKTLKDLGLVPSAALVVQ
jgi:hypothetical protein